MKKLIGVVAILLGAVFVIGLVGNLATTGSSNVFQMAEFSWPGLANSILTDVSDGLSNLAAMMG